MEYIPQFPTGHGEDSHSAKILCCECGTPITPNAANMCIPCVRSKVDITEGLPRQCSIAICKGCERVLQPPDQWVKAPTESRQLLGICLKKLKGVDKFHLVNAGFIWTEPHSKRIKVKVTVQAEVMGGAILQQVVVVEFTTLSQLCNDCHRFEAKDFWRAVVQVRQKSDHKKTLYYLEQLMLKNKIHEYTSHLKLRHDGLDFYYSSEQAARRLVDFLTGALPCRYQISKQLVSHDEQNSTYNNKVTFSVEIVPVCKDSVVCLSSHLAHQLAGIGQICVVLKVTNTIHLIDPKSSQVAEVTASTFWREPFGTLCSGKKLTEFIVMEIEPIQKKSKFSGQGTISPKHVAVDVYVCKPNGMGDPPIHTRSHLGHLLSPGDTVLGFDMRHTNVNDENFEKLSEEKIPDVVLVKKFYEDQKQKRRWRLKHFCRDRSDTDMDHTDYEDFLNDLEEDASYRENVEVFRDLSVPENVVSDIPGGVTLEEMLQDLKLSSLPGVEEWTPSGTKQPELGARKKKDH